jgi:aminoglycoside phosphotransferase (APT) family kinase protein
VLAYGERNGDEPSWVITEYIPHDEVPFLSPEMLAQLGDICSRLHAIPLEYLDAIGPSGLWQHYFPERLARRLAGVADYCYIQNPSGLVTSVSDILALCEPKRPSLLHLDLRAENLCLVDGRIVAVLDLANAIVGDPLFELGRLRAFDLLTDDFLRGYAARFTGSLTDECMLLSIYELETTALLTAVAKEELMNVELFDRMRRRTDRIVGQLEAL